MPEPVVTPLIAKGFSALAKPVLWLWQFFSEGTKLFVQLPKCSDATSKHSSELFQVKTNEAGIGIAFFAIATSSSAQVEVSCVSIHYAAPIKLTNPGAEVFFVAEPSNDPHLPFGLVWRDVAKPFVVRKDQQAILRFEVDFGTVQERHVDLVVIASVLKQGFGGRLIRGSQRLTKIPLKLSRTSVDTEGLLLKPKHIGFMPQVPDRPLQFEVTEGSGPLLVHYFDANLQPHSHQIIIPENKNTTS